MENYYKNKYLIALYDREDFIFAVADNVKDLLEVLSIPVNATTLNQMTSKIGRALNRKNKIYVDGKPLFIHLIPVEENEEVLKKANNVSE